MAWSIKNDCRGEVIAQEAARKRRAGLLPGSSVADVLLPEGAQGPLPSLEAQNAADLAAMVRANAAMPARIACFADAALRLAATIADLVALRRHYGHPVNTDSKFKLFNARQRMFRGWCGWIGLFLF